MPRADADLVGMTGSNAAQMMGPYACRWRMDYTLQHEKARTKVAVLVSKMDHCLWDLLIRHRQGEACWAEHNLTSL